jgi:hypothetical protein
MARRFEQQLGKNMAHEVTMQSFVSADKFIGKTFRALDLFFQPEDCTEHARKTYPSPLYKCLSQMLSIILGMEIILDN